MPDKPTIATILRHSYAPLGEVPLQFIEHAMSSAAMQQPADYLAADDLPELLKHFQFKIQSWPFFVSPDYYHQVELPATELPALIAKIPELFFDNNIDQLCDYFDIENKLLFSMLFNHKWRGKSLIARGDFINTSEGLMCLEQNIGSEIGGWDLEVIADAYLDAPGVSEFLTQQDIHLQTTNVLKAWFGYSIDSTLTHTPLATDGQHNMFVIATNEYSSSKMASFFNSIYRQALDERKMHGQIFLATPDKLTVTPAGVFFQEQRIHALLNPLGLELPALVLRAYMACKVFLADETISSVLSDKRTLALLSANADDDSRFTQQQQQLIQRHLPWTRVLVEQQVSYQGKTHDLKTLAIESQAQFVIKHAKGRQGLDLFIGSKTSPQQWLEVVEQACQEGCWIIQQFYPSLPYLGQQGDQGFGTFNAIWGTFIFGDKLAKIWLRLQPTANASGIINSHQGAEETMVYIVSAADSHAPSKPHQSS